MSLDATRPFAGMRRIMIFIDAGYLRNLQSVLKTDNFTINFRNLVECLKLFASPHLLFPDLIRVYYYCGVLKQIHGDEKLRKQYEKQQNIAESLKVEDYFEVREGLLTEDNGRLRQKGVDTIIAVDILSKAYKNHYDVAVLVAGDDDFVDVARAVKNAGKRIYGAYIEGHISELLKKSFDKRLNIDKDFLKSNKIVTTINS